MPGTWGSVVAVILAWFLYQGLPYWIIGFSVVGLWACRPATVIFHSKDPKQFVMDEVCGMMFSVLWLPKSMLLFCLAFVLFRALDVWKPWPISKIQDSSHPSSIMWDDIAAGLFANLILRVAMGTVLKI